ncbi:hypothetical protein [Cellulomonas sp. Leaf395]|uniref:hypothetical protein n=1 Tax=Cellulomonas sp. Leaf395 TaxID=1736362 RepID=UPI0012FB50D4|nr:hypothetical protein [Cellulomonas sp. Leaf395]
MSPCRHAEPPLRALPDLRAALMGRHNTPDPAAQLPVRTRLGRFLLRWLGRIGLGLVAGACTLGVLLWAGTSWTASLWIAGTVAVIIPVAAWLASTVPGPDPHR